MDVSQEYCMMCEKANEIQEIWKPVRGDIYVMGEYNWVKVDEVTQKKELTRYYAYDDNSHVNMHGTLCQDAKKHGHCEYYWLPRQDQLQELSGLGTWDWFFQNYSYAEDFRCPGTPLKHSVEQIALMRIMENKYGKGWDGKDWIEIKKGGN